MDGTSNLQQQGIPFREANVCNTKHPQAVQVTTVQEQCLEPVAQMFFNFQGHKQTLWHGRHRQGHSLAASGSAKKMLTSCPHSQKQETEVSAFQVSLATAPIPLCPA